MAELPQAKLEIEAVETKRFKVLLMALRQALIIALGALEDYLQLERSIVPRRKRYFDNKNRTIES